MYFNVYTGNEEISKYEAKLIQQVDKAKLTTDKHIETRYGIGTIRNLSTSCKTLLNIVKHPEKVVNVEECGSDVLKIIFSLDNIKIYMSRYVMFIASIVRNYLFQGLKKVSKKEKDKKSYTVPAAISELEKITIVKNSKDVYIRRYGLTKKQRSILTQFGVSESCLNKVADRMNLIV